MASVQFRVLAFIACLLAGIFINSKLVDGRAAWITWLVAIPLYFIVAKPILRALGDGFDRISGGRDPQDWN